jgi:phosphoribosylformylglycinamidine synthase II
MELLPRIETKCRIHIVTIYLVEVRAASKQYDVQAQKLSLEIELLPNIYFPSLASIATSATPLTVRTAQLYYLTGKLASSEIEQLIEQLLVDPVVQEAAIFLSSVELSTHSQQEMSSHTLDVFFHPGVTDTLAESVLAGAAMLDITGLEQVQTGSRYILDGRMSETDVHAIAEALLYNPVIQRYTLCSAHDTNTKRFQILPVQYPSAEELKGRSPGELPVYRFHLSNMTDQGLLELSKTRMLALDLHEMRTIQAYYREQHREPTDVELETLAQTWSEHCSHKTFKATISYSEVDSTGDVLEEQTIVGLLTQYIMRATERIQPSWLVSAFRDNAGIIRFTQFHDLAFKVETHNHPSAIEPFGGANTGVGGVIRDVLGVSAQPIACTDVLCFGPPGTTMEELPPGILSPRRIVSGVIRGIGDYGNKMGIPTVNGAVLYNKGYLFNPLVFCGCLGILPHGSHPHRVQPGDRIVVIGGRTGRDGVHGATFSSAEMSNEIHAQAGSAVQIGAPITEKKVADVLVQARDRALYSAITDCGAGGFSSAIGEMGAEIGARVDLASVPLKYQGLAPWEIWLSEAQERMVLAVPPQHLNEILEICTLEEVEASVIGSFTDDAHLVVTYADQTVADMETAFLHEGRPERRLEAVWTRRNEAENAPFLKAQTAEENSISGGQADLLLALLRHPTIGSKEAIVRRYDHEVQGATILKPLVGRACNGPSDAAVLQPLTDEEINAGIVISNGINPLYGKVDPYAMATNAIDEALRNLAAVGGDIEHTAILDNFCWGNPTDPIQLGMLVRAVRGCYDAAIGFGVPFISGKDSLNNEYRVLGQRLPVLPTLLISAVGVIDNVSRTIDMSLQAAGNLLYQIGTTSNELAGSHYAVVAGAAVLGRCFPETNVPQVDFPTARTRMKALGMAIREGLVQACHDLSEGGLAVALAEMALAGLLGLRIDLSRIPHNLDGCLPDFLPDAINTFLLFSESASRFIVEIAPEQRVTFEEYLRTAGANDFSCIGEVTDTGQCVIQNGEQVLIDLPVTMLQSAWKGEEQ